MTISWTFHGESGADPDIITTPIGQRGSMLVISSVGKDHNGNYTCTAKNNAGIASETAVLKVNGKSSAGRHWECFMGALVFENICTYLWDDVMHGAIISVCTNFLCSTSW